VQRLRATSLCVWGTNVGGREKARERESGEEL
jgi:hypothetical protein